MYTYDANGNVGQLVDLTPTAWDPNDLDAVMVARYEYEPFGRLALDIADANESGPYAGENPFRFSTKSWDDETGLGCWPLRYYDPATGRWISRDPIGELGGWNLYGYCGNQPSNAHDARGNGYVCCQDLNWPGVELGASGAYQWKYCDDDTRLCKPTNRWKCCASYNTQNMAADAGGRAFNWKSNLVPAEDSSNCGQLPAPPTPRFPPPPPPAPFEMCFTNCMDGVGCGGYAGAILSGISGIGGIGAILAGSPQLAILFSTYGGYCGLQAAGCVLGCQGL